MAFGISRTRSSPIAIDFGADTLKVLQINAGEKPQLVAAAASVLPESARQDPAERLAFLEEALRTALRGMPLKGRRALCAIPAFQMLVHNFTINRCDEEDTDAMIELQLRERLSLEPARLVIRNFRGAEYIRGGKVRRDVVTLAVKRELVMQYLQLAGRCKLEVVGLHPEPLALLRAFESLTVPTQPPTASVFIDLGGATTKLVIAHGHAIVLAKTVLAGGEHRVRRLATEEKLDFDEARRLHRRRCAGRAQRESPGGVAVAEAPAAAPVADEVLDTLTDEVRLAMRCHASRFPDVRVRRVVLVGGEAHDRPLARAVAQATGVPASLGDPFAGLDTSADPVLMGTELGGPQPAWAVAMGLCLSEANL